MWNELLGSENKLQAERKSIKISDVARGSNSGFETRLLNDRGRRHVCWVYYCLAVRRRDGATV